jgi:hypothetical protein
MSFQILITRGDDWETSYDVWAKPGSAPLEDGDGVFVGNYEILPSETQITVTPAAPIDDTYGVLVLPIIRRSPGIFQVVAP